VIWRWVEEKLQRKLGMQLFLRLKKREGFIQHGGRLGSTKVNAK
jgi:hypothetical protein